MNVFLNDKTMIFRLHFKISLMFFGAYIDKITKEIFFLHFFEFIP